MNIEMILKEMVVSLSPQEITVESVSDSVDLIKDFGFNSITLIQLVVNVESEFEFEFDDAMLGFESLVNFSKLVEYVKEKVLEVSSDE